MFLISREYACKLHILLLRRGCNPYFLCLRFTFNIFYNQVRFCTPTVFLKHFISKQWFRHGSVMLESLTLMLTENTRKYTFLSLGFISLYEQPSSSGFLVCWLTMLTQMVYSLQSQRFTVTILTGLICKGSMEKLDVQGSSVNQPIVCF